MVKQLWRHTIIETKPPPFYTLIRHFLVGFLFGWVLGVGIALLT